MTRRKLFVKCAFTVWLAVGFSACEPEDTIPALLRAEVNSRGCISVPSYVLDLDSDVKDGATGAFWCVYSESGTPPSELVFIRADEGLGCSVRSIQWTRPVGILETVEVSSRSLDSFTPANTQLATLRGISFDGPAVRSVSESSVATIVCFGGEWYYSFDS